MSAKCQCICLCLAILTLSLVCELAKGQTNTVSPKLDFDDTENKNNSSVPMVPGRNNARGNSGNDDAGTGGGNAGGSGVGRSSDSNVNSNGGGKTGPKIHGVRVTVDTGDGKNTKESKESVEITDLGKHKKRVGIHTDITFEITADGEVLNGTTTSGQRHNKGSEEDASVPIYKGRGGSGGGSRTKTRKPYDPKTRWNTNFSNERRGYDNAGRNYPNYGGYFPQYPHNIPVYADSSVGSHGGPSHGAGTGSGSGTVYQTRDGWTSFVPASWTTERSYSEYHQPNAVAAEHRTPSWKPCYCMSSDTDYRKRRDSHLGQEFSKPVSSVIHVIDSKLEQPFSSK